MLAWEKIFLPESNIWTVLAKSLDISYQYGITLNQENLVITATTRFFWFSCSSPWVTATNQIFLFVAVSHGDKPDFPVCRRESRTGKSVSSPWVTATNRKIRFVAVTHGDEQENLVCRRESRTRKSVSSPWLTATNRKIWFVINRKI